MKRFVVCLAALLGLAVLCPGAAQAAVRYELAEVGISIELPEDYITITRETPADDPAYEAFIWDKETMDALFEQQESYLNSSSLDYSKEISVTMAPMPLIKDFSWLNEANLETLAASFAPVLEEMGGTYLRSELYQHSQAKFIKIYAEATLDGSSYDVLKYYTVYDSKAININFFSYVEDLGEEEEMLIKAVVDSVRFGEEAMAAVDPGEYTDLETGLSFTLPEGWSQGDMLPGHSILKAKFVSDQAVIMYGNMDGWSAMSDSERIGLERGDIDQSFLTAEDIADIYGLDASEVSTATYGGREYYVASTNLGSPMGVNLGEFFEGTVLLRVENGYLFQFYCDGKPTDPQFKDMEAILNSARYPGVDNTSVPTLPPIPSFTPIDVPERVYTGVRDTERDGMSSEAKFVLAVIAAAAIGVTALLLWDRHRRRAAAPAPTYSFVPAQAAPAEPTAEEDPAAEEPVGHCPCCGAVVPLEVRFCHRCGNKLQVEENEGGNET